MFSECGEELHRKYACSASPNSRLAGFLSWYFTPEACGENPQENFSDEIKCICHFHLDFHFELKKVHRYTYCTVRYRWHFWNFMYPVYRYVLNAIYHSYWYHILLVSVSFKIFKEIDIRYGATRCWGWGRSASAALPAVATSPCTQQATNLGYYTML